MAETVLEQCWNSAGSLAPGTELLELYIVGVRTDGSLTP